MRHTRRARVRAPCQPVGGDGGMSLLMKHMRGKRWNFSNFSKFARVMHGENFSTTRDLVWRDEDSSGRGCRKMRRLGASGGEAGDLGVIAPVTVIPLEDPE